MNQEIVMRAVVLAGGKGTRLKPYTTLIPKPLVPIGGTYSILEILIMQLKKQGFTHVTLAVNHLSNLIMAYFGDGQKYGLEIDYSNEESELSTIGPLTLIADLPENFLVVNGDILSDLDYGALLRSHIQNRNEITVAAVRRSVDIEFGVLETSGDGRLTGFREKPRYEFSVSMGVYALHVNVVKGLQRGQRYGFDNLMADRLSTGRDVMISKFCGLWLDIGRPADYDVANECYEEVLAKAGISR